MAVLVDWPLEEWAFSRALFPIGLIQERCARKKKEKIEMINLSMSEKQRKDARVQGGEN